MEVGDIIGLSVEGSLSLMLVVAAYKLYKMRVQSHSGCCLDDDGNGVVLETTNVGVSSEDDVLNKI